MGLKLFAKLKKLRNLTYTVNSLYAMCKIQHKFTRYNNVMKYFLIVSTICLCNFKIFEAYLECEKCEKL